MVDQWPGYGLSSNIYISYSQRRRWQAIVHCLSQFMSSRECIFEIDSRALQRRPLVLLCETWCLWSGELLAYHEALPFTKQLDHQPEASRLFSAFAQGRWMGKSIPRVSTWNSHQTWRLSGSSGVISFRPYTIYHFLIFFSSYL